jgi:phenylalanyl-tRNA synthetase beta chain
MRVLVSWLRDFVEVAAPAEEIASGLGLRGFEVAAVEPLDHGDGVIDFEVTANRPDCLSVLGFAREVSTLYDRPLALPSTDPGATIALDPIASDGSERIKVTIADDDLCPRYAALVARVRIGSSPAWLAARLVAAGIRPINSIVDITNYVLIELGHPTHAFDLTRLAGSEIRVRRAQPGETIRTLDAVQRSLEPDMLVICDRDRPQAVAGVMGGAQAEVSHTTELVVFESAYFKPTSVRRTSKRLGLKTEASTRFERGADIGAPVVALQRIAALMDRIGAGHPIGTIVDRYPRMREPAHVRLRQARLDALLGVAVPPPEVERILRRLGLDVTPSGAGWDIIPPTFRIDIAREVDLIEEVGRHYGFDKLPATFPVATAPAAPLDPRIARDQLVRRVLAAAGLSEAITFGIIESKAAEAFVPARDERPISVANPLSAKFDTLRPSLLPGLMDVVAHNRRRGRDDVEVFEIGTRFSNCGETRAVGMAWTGSATPVHWSTRPRPVDFFDVKGVVERLCDALGAGVRFQPKTESFLEPGQSATVVAEDGRDFGLIGQVRPDVAEARGLPRQDRVFMAELDLDAIWSARSDTTGAVKPLPRFPFVVRDLSILVSDGLPAEIIRGTIQTAAAGAPAPLTGITFFDRYQGKGVPEGRVSLSVRLTFEAPDRTLTDAEVQTSVETVLASLVREHGTVQR